MKEYECYVDDDDVRVISHFMFLYDCIECSLMNWPTLMT